MIELPIIENPWIQTYQIRNYELGILQNKTPWIYCKYINCLYNEKEEDCFNHCMSAGGRFFAKDGALLEQKFIFDKSIFSAGLIDFVDWVRNFLDYGWYAMCYVDEFYIEVKTAYQQYHYRHPLMIYGYDDVDNIFLGIGYNKNNKYKKFKISYDEFAKAVGVEFDKNVDPYFPNNIDKIEFNIVKVNPKYKFIFNIKELYISLSDYIDSKNSFIQAPDDCIYGLECESMFYKYIYNMKNNKSSYLDIRYSRLFKELKEIMVRRLEYLVQTEAVSTEVLDKYKDIAHDQIVVHMLFMKFNITNQEAIFDKLLNMIASIIEREKRVLPLVRSQLFDLLTNRERMKYLWD